MKRSIYRTILTMAVLLLPNVAWGDFPNTSGNWEAKTLDKNYTINLTGNIILKGAITIPKGRVLTIQIADSHTSGTSSSTNHIKITASSKDGFARMFDIQMGGKLIIKGKNTYTRIVLDGGARFVATTESNNPSRPFYISGKTVNLKTRNTSEGKDVTGEAIRSQAGTLDLDWVTIQNVYDTNTVDGTDSSGGGAINLNKGEYGGEAAKTTISNCIIQNCCDEIGSAIFIRFDNEENTNNPDKCATNGLVTITNTTIQYCYSSGTAAGTIRTHGRTLNSLTLDNVTIKNNYTLGSGGGIYWNAAGCGATKLTINNCTINNNVAKGHGGGLHIATNVNFTGENKIYKNHALASNAQGGGIRFFSYTGKTMPKEADGKYNFTYNLPNNLDVYENTAVNGAGIAYNLSNFKLYSSWDDADDNHSNVTINVTLNLNGATIHNNTATNQGAGIWLANDTGTEANQAILKQAKVNVEVNFNKGTISQNNSGSVGAGVFLRNANITHEQENAGTLKISDNIAPTEKSGGGIFIQDGKTIELSNVTTQITGNQAQNGAGIYLSGQSGVSVSLGQTTITNNIAQNNGGALYVNGGSISMKKTTITGNNANTADGGAVYLAGGNFTTSETTTISNNCAANNGGAIYVSGGKVTLNNATISNNGKANSTAKTKLGGAVYVTGTGSGFEAQGTSAINNNTSTTSGGAIYVNGGNVTLAANTISKNSSPIGGAIYAKGNVTLSGTSNITENEATGDGGAIYIDGGSLDASNAQMTASTNSAANGGVFCVNGGSVKLNDASITHNTANANGGAIALYNGGFSMTSDSYIQNNQATNYGGGLYVYNNPEATTAAEVSCEGGTFTGNTAKAGGAVCAEGKINLSLAANMENNQAQIGGGIYMADGVNMTFGNGLIRANMATVAETDKNIYTTASNHDVNSVAGVGGGIFMANNATLIFNSQEMGIYNNSATNAGADICANGKNTSITLPPIEGMSLKGFDVPGNDLYWVYDYFNDDSKEPGNINNSEQNPPMRYEQLLLSPEYDVVNYIAQNNKTKPKMFTNYVCLDLGYDLVFVNFTTLGLDPNDNAVILMSYPKEEDGGTIYKLYRTVLFNGNQKKTVGLPTGDWKLEASDWSVHYKSPTFSPIPENSVISFARNGIDKVDISFTKKTEHKIKASKVSEHYKINRMIIQ